MKNTSLQDQLLKAGLTSNAKAKEVKSNKKKQTKMQRKNKVEPVDEAKQLAEEAKTKQLEKDRLLNSQRDKAAQEKQIANQIVQLINLNKLPKSDDGVAYNFTDQHKVKTIYISEELRNKIIIGKMTIVKTGISYEVVPSKVADKIRQRDEQVIIVSFADTGEPSEDVEYHGFEIPDDLMW